MPNNKALYSYYRKTKREPCVLPNGMTAIGIDIGINPIMATSEGAFYLLREILAKKDSDKISKYMIGRIDEAVNHAISGHDIICLETLDDNWINNDEVFTRYRAGRYISHCIKAIHQAAEVGQKRVVCISQYYASSKTCGQCGNINRELPFGKTLWRCPKCATFHHRDINAAENILREGLRVAGIKEYSLQPPSYYKNCYQKILSSQAQGMLAVRT